MLNQRDKDYNKFNTRKRGNKKKKENNQNQIKRYKRRIKFLGRDISNKSVNK